MKQKVMVALLTGVMCLMVGAHSSLAKEGVVGIYATPKAYQEATGKKIEEFKESPALKEKVAMGELPPVEERLPQEPLVLEPVEAIGQYGGTLRRVGKGKDDDIQVRRLLREMPLVYSSDMYAPNVTEVIKPNIFTSWTASEDVKTWTFRIRKGIKWSDGAPFTADDFMFWYDDIALNKEINPAGVKEFKVAGEMAKFKKIDDYTISYSFAEPYGLLAEVMCRLEHTARVFSPGHFLKQFLPTYTSESELEKKVKDAGFDTWMSLLEDKMEYYANPETPTISAWMPINKISAPVYQFVRNPYFWKIDTEGNQLPYIDGVDFTFASDVEALLLKTMAGEVDCIGDFMLGGLIENLPILKENKKRGNYKVQLRTGFSDPKGVVLFNYSHEDPVLREIFENKEFRIALSVAMDRKEINDIVFDGMAEITQPRPPDAGAPYYGELPQFKVYTQYDPQLANRLLDAVGLKWDKDHKVRLRPDGKPLELVVTMNVKETWSVKIAEMYKQYWEDVGVKITVKPLAGSAFIGGLKANTHDLAVRGLNWAGRRPFFTGTWVDVVPVGKFYPNPAWGLWTSSGGKMGEEPPEGIKRLYELHKEFLAEPSGEKRIGIGKEIYLIHCENLWVITAVQDLGLRSWKIVSNRLGNIPEYRAIENRYDQPSQWFIRE